MQYKLNSFYVVIFDSFAFLCSWQICSNQSYAKSFYSALAAIAENRFGALLGSILTVIIDSDKISSKDMQICQVITFLNSRWDWISTASRSRGKSPPPPQPQIPVTVQRVVNSISVVFPPDPWSIDRSLDQTTNPWPGPNMLAEVHANMARQSVCIMSPRCTMLCVLRDYLPNQNDVVHDVHPSSVRTFCGP